MAKTINFDTLLENAKKVEDKKNSFKKKVFEPDQRYFNVMVDPKEEKFSGVIRFLAPREEDDTFYVSIYTHSFEENGKKFFSMCQTTIGEKCPVCEYNRLHWKEYSEKQQSDRKRKLKYHSNIYVVSDPKNPTREGKVFLFAYGVSVYKKIMNMISPPKDGPKVKKPYNIFDEKTGKDFEMLVVLKSGFNNYDQCQFSDEPSELSDSPDKLKEIVDSTYILKDVLPKKEALKSYEETEKWLLKVLDPNVKAKASTTEIKSAASKVETAEAELWTDSDVKEDKKLELKDLPKNESTSEEDFFNF